MKKAIFIILCCFLFSCNKRDFYKLDKQQQIMLQTYISKYFNIDKSSQINNYFVYLNFGDCTCIVDNITLLNEFVKTHPLKSFYVLISVTMSREKERKRIMKIGTKNKNVKLIFETDFRFRREGNFYITDKLFKINKNNIEYIDLKMFDKEKIFDL